MKRDYLSLFVGVSLVFSQAHAGEGIKAIIERMCGEDTDLGVQNVRKATVGPFLEGMKTNYTQKKNCLNFLLNKTFRNQVLFRDSDQPGNTEETFIKYFLSKFQEKKVKSEAMASWTGSAEIKIKENLDNSFANALAGYPLGPAPKISFLSLLERKVGKYGARAAMLEDFKTRDPKAVVEEFSTLAIQKNPKNPSQKVAEYAAILEHLEERDAPPKGKFDTYVEKRDDISRQFEKGMLVNIGVEYYNKEDSQKFMGGLSSLQIDSKVHKELFPLESTRDPRQLFPTYSPLAKKLQEKFLKLKKGKGSSELFSVEEYREHLPLYSEIIMDHCYELFVDPTQEVKTFLQRHLDKWKIREQVALSQSQPSS